MEEGEGPRERRDLCFDIVGGLEAGGVASMCDCIWKMVGRNKI